MSKYFSQKVFVLPDTQHRFKSRHDAEFWCSEHNVSPDTIECYDSIKEYNRWLALRQLEQEGVITDLRRQVEFEIIPEQRETVIARYKTEKIYRYNDERFKTKREALDYVRRYGYDRELVGEISCLVPVYKERVKYKRAVYTADFVYNDNGKQVVEDVKSDYTRKEADYVLRKKLMSYYNHIDIYET